MESITFASLVVPKKILLLSAAKRFIIKVPLFALSFRSVTEDIGRGQDFQVDRVLCCVHPTDPLTKLAG